MTRKQIIRIGIIAGMLILAGILALGDLGKHKGDLDGSQITMVTAVAQANGIVLNITGTHPECDGISDWQQKRQRDLISVTPVFQRLNDVSCDNIIPLQETVMVNVGDLGIGTYRIDVLGATTNITLSKSIISFDFHSYSEQSFNAFPIDVAGNITKAALDTSSIVGFGTAADLTNAWNTATVLSADRLSIITVSCGTQCYKHAVVDMQTGKLIQMFSSQYGIVAQPGSKLLIVNDPKAIIASGTKDTVIAEAYVFNPDTRIFEFVGQGNYLLGELY